MTEKGVEYIVEHPGEGPCWDHTDLVHRSGSHTIDGHCPGRPSLPNHIRIVINN
jgi:hypothetical protein